MRSEADHLAAVSTIVTERRSLLSSSLVGAFWGLGHTLALLIGGYNTPAFWEHLWRTKVSSSSASFEHVSQFTGIAGPFVTAQGFRRFWQQVRRGATEFAEKPPAEEQNVVGALAQRRQRMSNTFNR